MKQLAFKNGDTCPALGLGTWKSDPGEAGAALKNAIELGYRHLDCAAIYGNEAEIGEALAEIFAAGTVKREDLWITSKLWNAFHRFDDVLPAAQKTLADLRLDYLDLYLMHWPLAFNDGVHFPESGDDMLPLSECPLSETWSAMEKLVEQGLCRHIGVANFSIVKLKSLMDEVDHRPEMNQIEMHPYLQQSKMVEYCRQEKIHLTAYAPLGSGGRPEHLRGEDEPVLLEDPKIVTIAERLNATPAQVLLAWALERGTAAIPKSTNPQRLAENLAATEVELSKDDIEAINLLDRRRRYFDGTVWSFPGTTYTLETLWDGEPAV